MDCVERILYNDGFVEKKFHSKKLQSVNKCILKIVIFNEKNVFSIEYSLKKYPVKFVHIFFYRKTLKFWDFS